MTVSIKDRAVIVNFSDRVWMGGAVNKEVGEQVRKANDVTAVNVGHYWQRLIPKAAIRPRANAGNAARNWHMKNTLPWMEGSGRILPVANLKDYLDGMRKLIEAAKEEERKLVRDLPVWVDEAKRTQGKLFRSDRYPSQNDLASKFGIDIDILPMPNIADWRVDLADEQVAELRAAAEGKLAETMREGVMDLLARMQEVVEHAKDTLSDSEKTFRNSLIGNIKSVCEMVGKLNVTGDKEIEALRKEMADKLAGLSPDTLRLAPDIRAKAAKDAGDIMKKMASFMGGSKVAIPAKSAAAKTADKPAVKADSAPKRKPLTEAQKATKNANARAARAAKAK